jgi:hypothetical protein
MTMATADQIVDRGADLLRDLAEKARAQGGIGARIAPLLAEDSAFLRKLKPSLVAARIRGETSTNGAPGPTSTPPVAPRSPSRPVGPSPVLVAGLAFVVGVFAAKLVDWRGHAHPRD